jgi:hypothetical protein
MENIAATVDTIPRLAEIMREYITEQISLQDGDVLLIDKVFVQNLFNDCGKNIDSRYDPQNLLNDKIL